MSDGKLYSESVLGIFKFPVPDFFETHEILEYGKVMRYLNKFEDYFIIVETITGANQITVRRMLTVQQIPRGQQIIFTLPGRMTLPDEERFIKEGKESGWSRVSIDHKGIGLATYSRFTLTRLFGQ